MDDATADPVQVAMTRSGGDVRVDARPARLVSQLRGDGHQREVSVHTAGGASLRDALPGGARRATFLLTDEVSVETTPAAEFVAMVDDSGRTLVLSLGGEVSVVPSTTSDHFALAAAEALVIPAPGATPRVVSTEDLSEHEETRRDRKLVAAAMAVGLVVVVILIVVLARGDGSETATTATPTTATPTTATPTTATPTTATPTTAAPTTTAPASYDFRPQSCVQQADTITYTASITNTAEVAYDYTVKVAFRDGAGATVTTAEGRAARVAPATTATVRATGRSATLRSNSGASCAVQTVTTTPSA